ncbi:glycosyltransferase [Pontibacter sp. JAM-7]|uniref:glycosyltransferase n=1 Tax=Pontibacter sp. JAM-7 TaxID=3366581 RepID=UPI003AF4FE70
MKKLFAICENMDDKYGGPAVSLASLVNHISKKIPVELVSVKLNSDEKNSTLNSNVMWSTFSLTGPRSLMFSLGLFLYLYRNVSKNDVIYLNNLWNLVSLSSYLIVILKDCDYVVAPRGSLFPWALSQSKIKKKIAWWLFQKSAIAKANVIHVTSDEESKCVQELGFCVTRILMLPHGIDFPSKPSHPVSSDLHFFDDKKRYFIFLSRLHQKKGLDILLDVWVDICKRFPDWVLLVVGPDYGDYVSKINTISCPQIQYLGFVRGSSRFDLLRRSEFMVLPSYTENFGVVVGESLSCSTPVLTTTNTPWDVLNKLNCGACVGLDDFPSSLASFLQKTSLELSEMGAIGEKLILDEYSWNKKSDDFIERCCQC